ncbi:hypothetical protein ACFOGI_04450 [Virgibacillus xinjiangensis]|uniref:Lipoprotein n=1 Tax=Virgibacillus xinjiangensis TaxID=393090 RepID=A0ABV7CSX8_9BACI
MKKFIIILTAISLSMFITACGSEDIAGDTNSDSQSNEVDSNTSEDNNTNQNEQEEAESESEAELEIVQTTGGTWKDSIDSVWVHSSAVFENTGDTPVKIGETQMNYKDTDGGILGTSSMIYSVPSVVAPGEKAFISETTILDGVNDASVYGETTYNFNYDITDEKSNLLEVSGVKGTAGADEYSTPYKVTGVVKNTTEEMQDDIRIAAALFAEDGTLQGVLKGSVDVGVNPGSEAGFELTYPEIPREDASNIETVEVKAYGWKW